MKNPFPALTLAATLAVTAPIAAAQEALEPPCKNHYILRCDRDDRPLSWKMLPDSSIAHGWGHSATLLADGRVLVVGGTRLHSRTGGNALQDRRAGAETYDPMTQSWQASGPMNRMRTGHQAVRLLDGRVLVVGGDEHENIAEIFDPTSGSWTPTGRLIEPREGFTASLLADGKVLVAGGYGRDWVTRRSAELYDPATDRWQLTASLSEARLSHTATALPDGRVLVVGGLWDSDFMYTLGSTEVFDPATGEWSMSGSIGERWIHTATLAEDGTVVVAGGHVSESNFGFGTPDVGVDSTAIYDPGKGTWSAAGNLGSPRQNHLAVRLRGYGVLLMGGEAWSSGPRGFVSTLVERGELMPRGKDVWRGIPSVDALSPANYYSATELADGSVLFIGDLDGARAALLGPGDQTASR